MNGGVVVNIASMAGRYYSSISSLNHKNRIIMTMTVIPISPKERS